MTAGRKLECGACGAGDLQERRKVRYNTAAGPIETPVRRCSACGGWQRDLDPRAPEVVSHFAGAAYTRPEMEKLFRKEREGFFRFIRELVRKGLGGPPTGRLLDVGCAYGHLMDLFREVSWEAEGIEIVTTLREDLTSRGYRVHADIAEAAGSFDAITLIDSLYYFDNPLEALGRLRDKLTAHGVIVIRVTNRPPLLDLLYLLGRPITNDLFGDSKFAFSRRGIEALCERAGLRVERTILRERGKRLGLDLRSLYYLLSPLLSRLAGRTVTPGIVLVLRHA